MDALHNRMCAEIVIDRVIKCKNTFLFYIMAYCIIMQCSYNTVL